MPALDSSQRIDALKLVPLFSPLHQDDLDDIAKRAEEVEIPKGAILAQEGREGRECFLILEGTAVVRRQLREVARIGAGDVFGEMSLIDGQPQSMTVQMLEPSVVLVIKRADFIELVHDTPGFAEKLLVGLSIRLREANERLLG